MILFITNLAVTYRIETFRLLQLKWGKDLLFLFSYGPFYDYREPRNLPFRYDMLRSISFPAASKNDIARGVNPRRTVINFDLPLWLIRLRPQVLITTEMGFRTIAASLYCWVFRRPLVLYWEGTMHTERNIGFLKKILRRLLIKFPKTFVCNGVESEEYLRQAGAKGLFIRGGLGADVARIADETEKARVGKGKRILCIQEEKFCFVFMGQMIPRKGVPHLLEAAHMLEQMVEQPFEILMLGDGQFLDAYKKLTDALELQCIQWLGQVAYDRVPAFLACADCLVLPTLEDNWSLVVLEAMAAGLAILSSKFNGGTKDLVIPGENGYSFDPTEHRSFAEKMLALITMGDRINEFKEKSRIIAREFSADKVANRFSEAIHAALKQ